MTSFAHKAGVRCRRMRELAGISEQEMAEIISGKTAIFFSENAVKSFELNGPSAFEYADILEQIYLEVCHADTRKR